MLIAIIVLFTLYLTNSKKESPTTKITSKKIAPNPKSQTKNTTQKTDTTTPNKNSNCPHHFGYLKKRKEKGIPDECTGCTQLIKCLLYEE